MMIKSTKGIGIPGPPRRESNSSPSGTHRRASGFGLGPARLDNEAEPDRCFCRHRPGSRVFRTYGSHGAVNPSGKYPRNRIAFSFYFTGGSVSVSGANAPPMTGRALKLVDWLIVSYKSGNGVAEVLVFA